MVGGCSIDLQNSYVTTQRKANNLGHTTVAYSSKATNNGLNSAAGSKHGFGARQRQSNTKAGGPMQLEPNPVFSLIDAKMDTMNKTTNQDRTNSYVEPSSDSEVNTMKMS